MAKRRAAEDGISLPKVEIPDVRAIKALSQGIASDEQQKRALNWIVNEASAYYDLSFRPDSRGGERSTTFAEGRRFVGAEIVRLIKLAIPIDK